MSKNSDIEYEQMSMRMVGANNLSSAEIIVPMLIELINPKSVIDIGCATGVWLSQFQKQNISITGVDGNWVKNHKSFINKRDIVYYDFESNKNFPINTTYDLAICLEMAEHVSRKMSDKLISILTSLSDVIYFSAATPNSGGRHHVNERWQSYWCKKFKEQNYILIDAIRPKIFTNKKCCYFYAQESFIYINKNKIREFPLLSKYIRDDVLLDIVHPELFMNQIVKPSHEWSYLFSLQKKLINSMLEKYLKNI